MNEARKDGERENDLEVDLDRWRGESPAAGRYSDVQEKRKEKKTRLRRRRKSKSEARFEQRRAV